MPKSVIGMLSAVIGLFVGMMFILTVGRPERIEQVEVTARIEAAEQLQKKAESEAEALQQRISEFENYILDLGTQITTLQNTIAEKDKIIAQATQAPVKDQEKTSVQSREQLEELEIEALKFYMASKSHAAIDIKFTNSSSNDIQHWSISIEVYDLNDKYLARGEGMVSHIWAGESKVEEIGILDTQASSIAKWKASLTGVVGYSGLREDKNYTLKVIKH